MVVQKDLWSGMAVVRFSNLGAQSEGVKARCRCWSSKMGRFGKAEREAGV